MCTKKFTEPFAQPQNKLDLQKAIVVTSINDAVQFKRANTRSIRIQKDLPKRDTTVRNVKTSLLVDIDNLNSIHPPN